MRNLRTVKTIIVTVVLCLPQASSALMPPMSQKELERESNRIVGGKVLDVVCTGEHKETHCAKLTGYKATLEVSKTIKGKRHKKLHLFFMKYDFNDGCVGSPDTVHYPGEEGLYYLECKEDNCWLTHWNGVEYKSRGKIPLPKCRWVP